MDSPQTIGSLETPLSREETAWATLGVGGLIFVGGFVTNLRKTVQARRESWQRHLQLQSQLRKRG